MWIFAKPLQQLRAADLEALIASRVREHIALEFKREMYGPREPDIKEMLRDVASIANAEGGVLLIGMEEHGDGTAKQLRPVADAETQAARLISSCSASVSDRIPGLQAMPVPITGGDAIVVRIPRSYRRPHMITFGGATDFWARHDRQKSRMSMAEIRTAITTTEDLAVKNEQFVEGRRSSLSRWKGLALTATPLLLEEGRIDVADSSIRRLLQAPPSYRQAGGMTLSDERHSRIIPTLTGVATAKDNSGRALELYRTGHLESRLYDFNGIVETRNPQPPLLLGWAIAEVIRNFLHLLDALRDLTSIADPYVVSVSAFRIAGHALYERGGCRPLSLAPVQASIWDEEHLLLPPIQVPLGEPPDTSARLLLDRFWNAFHFEKCPFFDAAGQFLIHDR